MKPAALFVLSLTLAGGVVSAPYAQRGGIDGGAGAAAHRETLNFNPDWRFLKDDPAGASAGEFDDSTWTLVSAPHTYNDIDTFDNPSTPGHRGEQIQWSGRTWYRKTFNAPASWQGRKVFIEFEAVRQI